MKLLDYLKEWCSISFEIAEFSKLLYEIVDFDKYSLMSFHYCKIYGGCLLVQRQIILPEPEGEYISFVHDGLDFELIKLISEEGGITEELMQ